MHGRSTRPRPTAPIAAILVGIAVAACGGGAVASSTTAPPTPGLTLAASIPPATAVPIATIAEPTDGSTGPASLEAIDEVEAGAEFQVSWTGPNAQGDYITIVRDGATRRTNEPYFSTADGSPGTLTAPSGDGTYALWYVSGADDSILARRTIRVTPFEGDLLAPDSVMANTEFEVAWNGPDGPGDYVTIVKAGAPRWTNEDYFNTTEGSPGELLAGVEPGSYEIWYVIGADHSVQARRPITVTPVAASLEAPKAAAPGARFDVTWSGPDGGGDFITIVPVGAAPDTYLSYFYTRDANPGTLTAPDAPGSYEIRYVAGQADVVFATAPIEIR